MPFVWANIRRFVFVFFLFCCRFLHFPLRLRPIVNQQQNNHRSTFWFVLFAQCVSVSLLLLSDGPLSIRSSIISCSILLQIDKHFRSSFDLTFFLSLSIHHSHSQRYERYGFWEPKKANAFLTQLLSGPFSHNKSPFVSNSSKHYRMAPNFPRGKTRRLFFFSLAWSSFCSNVSHKARSLASRSVFLCVSHFRTILISFGCPYQHQEPEAPGTYLFTFGKFIQILCLFIFPFEKKNTPNKLCVVG